MSPRFGLGARIVTLSFLFAGLAAESAHAAGYFIPGIGVRSQGRGTAFVVGGDDPTVMWENVAQLARLKGLQLHVDVNAVQLNFDHQRSRDIFGWTLKDPSKPYDAATNPVTSLKNRNETTGKPIFDRPLSLQNIDRRRSFMAPIEQVPEYDKVSNGFDPFPIPLFMLTYDMETDDYVIALGAYGPTRGNYRMSPDGPQRYILHEQDVFQVHVQFSFAAEFLNDRLRVGLGVSYMATFFRQRLALAISDVGAALTEQASVADGSNKQSFARWLDPDLDTMFELGDKDFRRMVTDLTQFGATAGIWGNPWKGLVLGASFFYQMDVDAEGKFKDTLPEGLDSLAQVEGKDGKKVRVKMNLPYIFRAGIGWQEPQWDVELAFVYETWSRHDKIKIYNPGVALVVPNPLSPNDPPKRFPLTDAYDYEVTTQDENGNDVVTKVHRPETPIIQEKKLKDAYSIRLGGAYHFFDPRTDRDWNITLRAGGYFESSGMPAASLSVDGIDGDKFSGSLGGTFSFYGVDLDFSFGMVYLPKRTVTNSRRLSINPVDMAFNLPGREGYAPGHDPASVAAALEAGDEPPVLLPNQIPVANGTYTAWYWMVGGGLTLHFDRWYRDRRADPAAPAEETWVE